MGPAKANKCPVLDKDKAQTRRAQEVPQLACKYPTLREQSELYDSSITNTKLLSYSLDKIYLTSTGRNMQLLALVSKLLVSEF